MIWRGVVLQHHVLQAVHVLTIPVSNAQAKQKAMEELTPGQAAVLARNEQQIEKVSEEMEDLEEVLTDSIADSIRGKRQKAEADAGPALKRRSACYPSAHRFQNTKMIGQKSYSLFSLKAGCVLEDASLSADLSPFAYLDQSFANNLPISYSCAICILFNRIDCWNIVCTWS